ncbi:hypothetical protein [Chroococcidiopsis cubana]|uniref:hypothetical protein n=1 Tax=Chroococcidiopsis cubana TaxID=171392 RepID=UPI000F8E0D44|nr:hypothetical protein [Chroococcidiopsis cubana]
MSESLTDEAIDLGSKPARTGFGRIVETLHVTSLQFLTTFGYILLLAQHFFTENWVRLGANHLV